MKMTLENLHEILAAEFGEGEIEELLDQAREEDAGICLACGDICYGVEPDARRYQCECCMKHGVFGVEEVALRLVSLI